ncbi:MAG: ImmA/IrrE family metallo-endopeptidase [Pseudomonadota bacterium]
MQQFSSPFLAAAKLTHWLDAFASAGHLQRFPVAVDDLALWVGSEMKWADPVLEVKGARISSFEGGLFHSADRGGWLLLYNESMRSPGRIRFTKAHELGHYVLHRSRQSVFECTQEDMVHWGASARQLESEADDFASNLLMPLTHFRSATEGSIIDFDVLGACADKFGVSLTAAALRWVKSTLESAVLILSRDGFIDWSVSSDRAFKNGAYFKTRNVVTELPQNSLTAASLTESTRMAQTVAAKVWFPHAHASAELREMNVVCDNYGYTLTVLHLSPGEKVWSADSD